MGMSLVGAAEPATAAKVNVRASIASNFFMGIS
jgi:hypothetical protein